MAQVYWIRKTEHTDMFSEGYIGYTSRDALTRFGEHLAESKSANRRKDIIHKAISKYGDNLVLDVLVDCDEYYGLWLEKELRPLPKTGWNTVPGGSAPPNHNGRKRTAAQNFAQSRRMIASGISPKQTPEVLEKIRQTKLNKGTWNFVEDSSLDVYWEKADILHYVWSKYKGIDTRVLCHVCELPFSDRLYDITRYFQGGFCPASNETWKRDFKPNCLKSVEGLDASKLFLMEPHYRHNRANKLWTIADEVRLFLEDNPSISRFAANKHFGLPDKSINLLYKKLKDGWMPSEDTLYQTWLSKYNQIRRL